MEKWARILQREHFWASESFLYCREVLKKNFEIIFFTADREIELCKELLDGI